MIGKDLFPFCRLFLLALIFFSMQKFFKPIPSQLLSFCFISCVLGILLRKSIPLPTWWSVGPYFSQETGLELLGSNSLPPTSASRIAGTSIVFHATQLVVFSFSSSWIAIFIFILEKMISFQFLWKYNEIIYMKMTEQNCTLNKLHFSSPFECFLCLRSFCLEKGCL